MPFLSSTALPSARTLTCPCVTYRLLYMQVVIDMWSRTPVERDMTILGVSSQQQITLATQLL